jgi:hypothetical protein
VPRKCGLQEDGERDEAEQEWEVIPANKFPTCGFCFAKESNTFTARVKVSK